MGDVLMCLPRFYIQDSGDGLSSTSDGIFVYLGYAPKVKVGDEVAVTGTVSDKFSQTQIAVSAVSDMVRSPTFVSVFYADCYVKLLSEVLHALV